MQHIPAYAQFQCKLRDGPVTLLQQPNRFELEFLAEPLPLPVRIDLLQFFSHLTPPQVLSTFKSVHFNRDSSTWPPLPNLSAGMDFERGLSAIIYINNVTDEKALLSFDRERGGRARLGFATDQPRTIGVTIRKTF